MYSDFEDDFDSPIIPELTSLEFSTEKNSRPRDPTPNNYAYEIYEPEYRREIPVVLDNQNGNTVVVQKAMNKPLVEVENPKENINIIPVKKHQISIQIEGTESPTRADTIVKVDAPVEKLDDVITAQPVLKLEEPNLVPPMIKLDDYDNQYENHEELYVHYTYDDGEEAAAYIPVPITMNFGAVESPTTPTPLAQTQENEVQKSSEDEKLEHYMNQIIYSEDSDSYSDLVDYEPSPGMHRNKGLHITSNKVERNQNQKQLDSVILSSLLSHLYNSNENDANDLMPIKTLQNSRKKKKVEKQKTKVRGLIGQLLQHVGKLITMDDKSVENFNIGVNVGFNYNSKQKTKMKISFDLNL